MEKKNIIAKVDYPTDWISNLVLVKSTKKLRICIDPQELNVALKRAEYPIPTIEEIIPNLQNAKIFTVVDTKDGFWNVKLSDESSNLTTFWTPFGRYKFLRMPFGLKTASEEYQRRLYEIFQGLEGIEIIADDILILGKDLDIGQEVYVRTPNTTPSWSKANITNEHNTRSYDVNIHGRTYRRNRTWIKPQQASANQKSTNNQEEGRKESIDQEQTVSNCLPSTSSAGEDNIVKRTQIETTECRIQSKSDSPTDGQRLGRPGDSQRIIRPVLQEAQQSPQLLLKLTATPARHAELFEDQRHELKLSVVPDEEDDVFRIGDHAAAAQDTLKAA
ncbi:K02A2.6-like [Cordylochernes scorpioides]|uniref:K02A2.6-like n=1 Tax=Cordylochernes scorpioides TaxID=51811 RepID=A0ABY6KYM8_9ARAC|nr:K02A2.6-like [Cordylochernes scorpioides]